jgi:hypothetical protein
MALYDEDHGVVEEAFRYGTPPQLQRDVLEKFSFSWFVVFNAMPGSRRFELTTLVKSPFSHTNMH